MGKFTWAPIVPLIGGFPTGTEQAFGTPPEEIFSYSGIANDDQYVHYQNETLGRNIPYTILEDEEYIFDRKINVIVGTPPCSGLSQLNTSRNEAARGANADANRYMYMIFNHGMKKYHADAVVIENAPALATIRGKEVADRLFEICKENGYSLTLYKTSTHLHGIPQRRDRTFAIAWRTENCPVMEYESVDRKNFADYLAEIPEDATQQDLLVREGVPEYCGYWNYIKENIGEPRKVIEEAGANTSHNYFIRGGHDIGKVAEWLRKNGTDRQLHVVEHAINKFSQGLGIWDGSIHHFTDMMNAVISRNISDTVHPVEDRSLNIREVMHMMGMPYDMELQGGVRNTNMIAQNVPVCTARFISGQIKKFLEGKLAMYGSPYVRQDNWNHRVEFRVEETEQNVLTEFMG